MDLSAITFPRSPFVWLTYRKSGSRQKFYEKTNVRKNDPDCVRKTALAKNAFERKMLNQGAHQFRESSDDWGWVEPWLSSKYKSKPRTLIAYRARWDNLYVFLEEEQISGPGALSREDCFNYAEWRTRQVKPHTGGNPSVNTAIGELKLLGGIMREAMERGFTEKNPCRQIGLSRVDTSLKPEITAEQEQIISEALCGYPDWMGTSFRIAMLTGLRFSDTRISQSQIRWPDKEVLIDKPKGGRRREFCIPIYRSLLPLLQEFARGADPYIWTMDGKTPPGIAWRRFFDSLGMSDVCFHCTRVTFITRGMRAGIPEPVMMKLTNHASTTVSRVYQRWAPQDVRAFADRIAAATTQSLPATQKDHT